MVQVRRPAVPTQSQTLVRSSLFTFCSAGSLIHLHEELAGHAFQLSAALEENVRAASCFEEKKTTHLFPTVTSANGNT